MKYIISMKFIVFTTCMNRTNALKALLTIAICTTRTSCSSCSNRNRDLNKRRVLDILKREDI